MENKKIYLDNLKDIKNLMEQSTRFMSLSGLSGISAGLTALVGAAIAFFLLHFDTRYININEYFLNGMYQNYRSAMPWLILDFILVLMIAFSLAFYFSYQKSKRKNLVFWNPAAKRLLINLFIPLLTGGIFCAVLIYHHLIFLAAPATLIFYGLALLNAGKYTLNEIKYLGIAEIFLGLFSSFFIGYGLISWAIGFGILHIVYGIIMYYRYDRSVHLTNE